MEKEKSVDPENIAGIIFDEEKGEQQIFTKDQLINQIRRVCADIAISFDKIYDAEFKNLSASMSYILLKQYKGFSNVVSDKDELRILCGNLLRNAANTIIGSISLLRDGFRLQSGILLRTQIEICATVVHLLMDKKALTDFNNHKYNSTYAISFANKQIPIFGKAWGLLSNHQIHINTIHADWYPMVAYEDNKEIPSTTVLGIIGYGLMILEIVTELTYAEEVEPLTYWELKGKGKYQFVPPKQQDVEWIEKLLSGIIS